MTKTEKCDCYLDWVNNYPTIEKFAADRMWNLDYAAKVINDGRKIHEENMDRSIVDAHIQTASDLMINAMIEKHGTG